MRLDALELDRARCPSKAVETTPVPQKNPRTQEIRALYILKSKKRSEDSSSTSCLPILLLPVARSSGRCRESRRPGGSEFYRWSFLPRYRTVEPGPTVPLRSWPLRLKPLSRVRTRPPPSHGPQCPGLSLLQPSRTVPCSTPPPWRPTPSEVTLPQRSAPATLAALARSSPALRPSTDVVSPRASEPRGPSAGHLRGRRPFPLGRAEWKRRPVRRECMAPSLTSVKKGEPSRPSGKSQTALGGRFEGERSGFAG